nr:hypothetical protein [Tanacetum cinerariifolium]
LLLVASLSCYASVITTYEREDRLLALEVVAGCLSLVEVDSLGPAAAVGGVTVVQQGTELLRVLMSGYHLDRDEHVIIPDIVPVHLVSP